MKNLIKFLLSLLLLMTSTTHADSNQCTVFFAGAKGADAAYFKRSSEIAKKYPQFKSLLQDPQKYFNQASERFEAQKKKNSKNPYQFDFSEWGIPLFVDMNKMLESKKTELKEKATALENGLASRLLRKSQINDLKIGIEYYSKLQSEMKSIIESGKVDYKTVFELSYFTSRAVGLFDISALKLLNWRDRLLLKMDEFTEGHKNLSVQEEMDLYTLRKVEIFDKKSPISTWQAAANPFKDALFNKNQLETLILPTTADLDMDIFMHLLNSEIYIVGVAGTPIAADGYRRPGGLFLLHDFRHSSFMYYRNLLYSRKHDLNRDHVDKLARDMALHSEDLDHELQKMTDKSLVGAIRFYLFNQHHDGGYKYSVENYKENNAYHAPFILYVQMLIAGQPREFKSIKDIARARQWLENFWLKKIPDENALLKEIKR